MSVATMTDPDLQRDVLEELRWEPSVDATHIGVSVKDGIVTLTGHVSSYAEKYAAERAAKRVYGVKAVANELDVKLPVSGRRTPGRPPARSGQAGVRRCPAGGIESTAGSSGISETRPMAGRDGDRSDGPRSLSVGR